MRQETTFINQKINKNAVTGIILGLISGYIFIAVITGPLAIFFSIIGMRQVRRNNEKGEKLAIIGLILGIIFFVFCLINLFIGC